MLDPDQRRQLAKQARLWTLSLICASVGAVAVWRTDNLVAGILAFAGCAAVLGFALWLYERRR